MGKLINRIPGSRPLMSSLPGLAYALPGKLDIKRRESGILSIHNIMRIS